MAQWYVKELSKITGITVQTLHHYDRINLLAPSVRLPNGYRVYSEEDLLRLQQILALKFFGFELEQIKNLLGGKANVRDHFAIQAKFLREKTQALMTATETLQNILARSDLDNSMPWETIIQLIEVFKMTSELEKSWAADVFTPDELKQYARFEMEKQTRFTPDDKVQITRKWLELVDQVRTNLDKDPRSEFGANLAKEIMAHVDAIYGKENANLRHSIWEKGFKKGKVDDVRSIEPEIVQWIDKATDQYYRERIYRILNQVEANPTPELEQAWIDIMTEMYGDSESLKQAAYKAGQDDSRVGPKAKKWLTKFYK